MRAAVLLALVLASCGYQPDAPGAIVHDARRVRADLEMKQLVADLKQHFAVHGEWPADWSAVKRAGIDPWGEEYAFEVEDDIAVVISAGPDHEFETGDDVVSR